MESTRLAFTLTNNMLRKITLAKLVEFISFMVGVEAKALAMEIIDCLFISYILECRNVPFL